MKRILILFFFIKQSYCMQTEEQQETEFNKVKRIFDSADGDMRRGIAKMYQILSYSKELDKKSKTSIKQRMKYAWRENWSNKSEQVTLLIKKYFDSEEMQILLFPSILEDSLDESRRSQYQKILKNKKEELKKIQADPYSEEYNDYKEKLLALQEKVSSKSYWRDTKMRFSSVIFFAILCNTLLCKKLCYENIVYDLDLILGTFIIGVLIIKFIDIYSSNKEKAKYLAETYTTNDEWAQEVEQAIHHNPLREDDKLSLLTLKDWRDNEEHSIPLIPDDMKTIQEVIKVDKQLAQKDNELIKQCIDAYKEELKKDKGLYDIFKNISQVYIPDQKEVVSLAMIEFVEKILVSSCWYALPSQKKLIAQHLFFNKDK